jgi:predicted AAA+ superfamily ATPase
MVHMHIKIASELMAPKARVFYWRTTNGEKVDFIIEHGKKLLPVETKLTRNPSFSDAKNLMTFIEEHPQAVRGLLLHSGSSIKWLHSKVLALPWWWL